MARVLGKAGGSLNDASWAANQDVANIGAKGERLTAAILRALPTNAVVLHDVDIPIPGFNANIDHIVIVGKKVWLIDTKMWKPGRYTTLFGKTFRGFRRFPFADKGTLPMALRYFRSRISRATWLKPAMVVHPSNNRGELKMRWYRPQEAKAFTPEQFAKKVEKLARNTKNADPEIVAILSQYVK